MRHPSHLAEVGFDKTMAAASAESRLRRAAPCPPAPDEDVYILRGLAASGAGAGTERVAVGSDELAISEAFRRLRAGVAIDIWRGERWVGRCERAAEQSAPAPRPADSNRRRGALSGWSRRRIEPPQRSAG